MAVPVIPNLYHFVYNAPSIQYDPNGLASGYPDWWNPGDWIKYGFGLNGSGEFVSQYGETVRQMATNGVNGSLNGQISALPDPVVDKGTARVTMWTGVVVGTVGACGAVGANLFNGGASTAVWAGGETAELEAAKYGITLGKTYGGRFLQGYQRITKTRLPDWVWRAASRIFARNAKGEVVVVYGPNVGRGAILREVEMPILQTMNVVIRVISM